MPRVPKPVVVPNPDVLDGIAPSRKTDHGYELNQTARDLAYANPGKWIRVHLEGRPAKSVRNSFNHSQWIVAQRGNELFVRWAPTPEARSIIAASMQRSPDEA